VSGNTRTMGVGLTAVENRGVVRSTYQHIADRANEAKEIFQQRGIKLHRDSSLSRLLRSAVNLSTSWNDGERVGGIREILAASHANRVAGVIVAMAEEANAEQSLRRIAGNPMDLSSRAQSQGKDHLWELELCQWLRGHGLRASLIDPPDVVLDLAGKPFPIACKKIYSHKGVEAQMSKGVRQLRAFEGGGVVALNIDDLLPEDTILNEHDHVAASSVLGHIVATFIEQHRSKLERFVKAGRCDGVLVSASSVCDLEQGGPRFTTITDSTLWTLDSLNLEARARIETLRDGLL
jgi:hypothetical protein